MAEVELAQDALIVHVEGMDRLFTLRSRLEVPLSHVEGAEADPEEARRRWHGIMERGIWVPGPITAGTFYREGELVFWDVHDPEKTVVIRLRDERYARLIIEVEDPETTVTRVNEAVGATDRTSTS
jgi:hypothetical protein